MHRLFTLLLLACSMDVAAQSIPLVYEVENTGARYAVPSYPSFEKLPMQKELKDPLQFAFSKKKVKKFADWSRRRAEIANLIQHYEIGQKPVVGQESVKAEMKGDTLKVDVTVNGETMTLTSVIRYPKVGKAPYALMIGTSNNSLPRALFDNRPIALMNFNERQVNGYSQFRGNKDRKTYNFVRLYPELINNGAYSEWSWGVSRLIDGLQQLGVEKTGIDVSRIGVTGCSYAGKMALFSGAFDERIALTIAQEPGGGGAAAWRVSHTMEGVEDLDHTDYNWFMESLKEQFHGDSVYYLPYDHHELCAMIFPRALLILGNPDFKWLADPSAEASARAAKAVWEKFGVAERMDWSIVGGHGHCQLPESQFPIVEKFLDDFLVGKRQ